MEGFYNSTRGFVDANSLNSVATYLFGEDWESEDDVAQIEAIIAEIGKDEEYEVELIEDKDEDDIRVYIDYYKSEYFKLRKKISNLL